jgi:hypothetical protein
MQPDLRETSWSHGAVARTVPKRRIWRKLMVGGLLAGSVSLAAVAVPTAGAINDGRVPADECTPDRAVAVGDPLAGGGNPGINFHTPDVSPPVSRNNPGVSTGALGQLNSNAIGTCANPSLP